MNTAIAQHLNVATEAIIEVQEWARVLWVRVRGLGARFVSKKVVKVAQEKDWQTIGLEALTGAPVASYERKEEQANMFLPKVVTYSSNGQTFKEFEVNAAYNKATTDERLANYNPDYKFTDQDLL